MRKNVTECETDTSLLPGSRAQAKDAGICRYFTGLQCVHGHISPRLTVSGNCIECFKTVHKERISKIRKSQDIKHGFYWQRRNKRLADNSKNSREKWAVEHIKLILCRDDDGEYLHTTNELASMLERSYRAIERARNRYAENPTSEVEESSQ